MASTSSSPVGSLAKGVLRKVLRKFCRKFAEILRSPRPSGGKRWGMGMVVDGIAKFQALKFTFQGLEFPVKSLVLLVRRRIPQKFQALNFQNSGPEIWRIHPPPFHTPPFACLDLAQAPKREFQKSADCWHRCWQGAGTGAGRVLGLCFPKGPGGQHLRHQQDASIM